MIWSDEQRAGIKSPRSRLDGGGSAKRPSMRRSLSACLVWRSRGRHAAPVCGLRSQRWPAGKPVLAGQCQLRCRQRYALGDRPEPGEGVRLASGGGALQLASLAAKLIEVGAVGKLGHDVSSRPRLAYGLDRKTIQPNYDQQRKVDSSPAREPGGAPPRHWRQGTRPTAARLLHEMRSAAGRLLLGIALGISIIVINRLRRLVSARCRDEKGILWARRRHGA